MLSRRRIRPGRALAALLVCALFLAPGGCVFTRDKVVLVTAKTPENGKRREITTPVKAHLKDGSVVLFPQGLTVDDGVLRGAGEQYDLARTRRSLVYTVPLDQVAAVEAYEREVRAAESVAGTVVAAPFAYGAFIIGLLSVIVLTGAH